MEDELNIRSFVVINLKRAGYEAIEAGTFTWTDTEHNNSISYSIDDGSTWTTLTAGSSTPTINANSKVIFKASGLPVGRPTASSYSGIGTFSSSGRFNVMGNIMSLLYFDNFSGQTSLASYGDYIFKFLFSGCTSLTSAENMVLPATTLTDYCYEFMFEDCSSLTTAPTLLATTLATACYDRMFAGCTSLTTAPTLSATTLAIGCYHMMFLDCSSLTTAPTLPATTLTDYCYGHMFFGCTNLSNITCLATDISAYLCTSDWVNGVAASGTFTKASGVSWTTGDSGIPQNWTRINA